MRGLSPAQRVDRGGRGSGWGSVVVFSAAWITGVAGILGPASWSQPAPLTPEAVLRQLGSGSPSAGSQVETGDVSLDGRVLFSVAVSQPDPGDPESGNADSGDTDPENTDLENTDPENTDPGNADSGDSLGTAFPLRQRIEFIEARLLQLARSNFNPTQLQVESQVDPGTNQPVITVNGQYLLTITSLDAQLQGLDPLEWAEILSQIIREALILYRQEREPEFVWRRVGLTLALGLGTWLLWAGLDRWRQRLLQRRDRVRSELVQIPTFPVAPEQVVVDLSALDLEDPPAPDDEVGSPQNAQFVQRLHQLEFQLDLQQRLLWLVQVLAWGSAFSLGVGLFPQSRWIQITGLRWLRGPILRLGSTALVTYLLVRLSAYSIEAIFRAVRQNQWLIIQPETTTQDRISKRILTLSNVVKGATASLLTLIGLISAIALLGVNVVPLVTSLGVIGLGVSLAAQDLIKDLINGLLILLEDQYAEGDVVMIDGRGGLVERINLRITQLRNTEGSLITIPNSEIRVVENLSNGWARVDLGILVAYSTDIDQAMRVIETVAVRMSRDWEWKDRILDHPQMLGVDEFKSDGVLIRIWIKVRPLAQWEVAREFRRRIKIAFDQNRIQLPISQQEVWIHTSDHPTKDYPIKD